MAYYEYGAEFLSRCTDCKVLSPVQGEVSFVFLTWGEKMGRSFSRRCPHCSHTVIWPDTPTYPFCSERCRTIDLGLWANEEYRIPSQEPVDKEAWPESAVSEMDELTC